MSIYDATNMVKGRAADAKERLRYVLESIESLIESTDELTEDALIKDRDYWRAEATKLRYENGDMRADLEQERAVTAKLLEQIRGLKIALTKE